MLSQGTRKYGKYQPRSQGLLLIKETKGTGNEVGQILFELFMFPNILRAFRRVKYEEYLNNEKNICHIFKQKCDDKYIM